MNIKWQLVVISILAVLVVNLYQTNVQLKTEKTKDGNLITLLSEENMEIDEKKAEILRDARIWKNEFTTENKKPVKIGTVNRMGGKKLEELTLEKIDDSNITVTTFDYWYYYPSKEAWGNIIKNDETEKIVPIKEMFDCDNFVSKFSSNVNVSYLLNSAGKVFGKNTDVDTDITIGHVWNIFLAKENGESVLYFFEPQTDEILPVGTEIFTLGKTFKVTTVEWY